MNVYFSKPTTFLGRNGWFKATGLSITCFNGKTRLTPITSKGMLGRCEIVFPSQDTAEIIKALRKVRPCA